MPDPAGRTLVPSRESLPTPTGQLRCIDCSQPLTAADTLDFDRIRCSCGLIYALQLLVSADLVLWERARTERLFLREGEAVLLTTPLEAIKAWPGWAGGVT